MDVLAFIAMRTRTPHPAIVRYALYLYFISSTSFRLAAQCLESVLVRRSHVSLWKWVQKYSAIADGFRMDKHLVKGIFVDETLLQIDGKDHWLWIAYEPNLNYSCLMMHLSRERTIFVCYQFFKQLRDRCGSRKPIFTDDGARWYDNACKWLRLQHHVYGTDLKNLMERFVQQIKDRTECFDDNFPCRKGENCDRQHVWNWLKLFFLSVYIPAHD